MSFDIKNYKSLGSIVIVSGPSGCGKSSICRTIINDLPNLEFSVSCTTRQPRQGETDGRDYFFITREKFSQYISENRFIEYARVHTNHYGTLKSEVLNRITSGINVLLDIDVQGAMQIKKTCETDSLFSKCSEFIFILPPDMASLEKRLRLRATETEESIRVRLKNAGEEMNYFKEYTYCIVNDDLATATNQMKQLVSSFSLKAEKMIEKNIDQNKFL